MLTAGKLHSLNPIHIHSYTLTAHTHRSPHHLPRLPTPSRFSSLAAAARSHSRYTSTVIPPQSPSQQSELEPAISSHYTPTVGSPSSSSLLQLSQWNLTHRHIFFLNVVACAVAVSATWLFLSAIPTLLAFKRAAESLAKLMDVTREELPDTMAAIRLSSMEISDLTMELSDLGQEITQGVRSSTRAVRVAEESLRGVASMASSASFQRVSSPKSEPQGLAIAKSAREMKEGIVKGRAIFQMFFSLARFSKMALNYFSNRTRP